MPTEEDTTAPIAQPTKLSPRVHAVRLELVKPAALTLGGKQLDANSADYNAADVIHGWSAQERATGQPMLLTLEDFEAAIKAGQTPDKTTGEYTPHAPACSTYSPLKK